MRAGRVVWFEEVVDTITKYPMLHRHKLGTVELPVSLRARLTAALRDYPRPALAENTRVLAEVLRRRTRARPSDAAAGAIKPRQLLRYGRDETAPYLAHRVPGIFATAFRVFRETEFKMATFAPVSMLDFGSGPGTAIRAARQVWGEQLKSAVAIEPSQAMEEAAKRVLGDMEGLEVERRRHLVAGVEEQHDLVVASYSLGEIQDPVERNKVVRMLCGIL